MRQSRVRTGWYAALALLAGTAVAGCSTQSSIVPAHEDAPVVVVETASFAEAEIVGHIYGNALSRKGWRVQPRPQSGTSDDAVDAVVDGGATFTVGFTGELLHRFDPGSGAVSPDEVYTAMMAALPEGVTAADPAPAQDAPSFVVTRNTSRVYTVTSMSDLTGLCSGFTLGAREEVLEDAELMSAVERTYDCEFGTEVALGANPRAVAEALRAGRVSVGVVRSSDPVLRSDDLVVLDDDDEAIVAQNIVPVFRKGSLTEDQLELVNRVSGELTTDDIRELLVGVEFGTASPVSLADFWLDEHGY